jgi:hypothetical protein
VMQRHAASSVDLLHNLLIVREESRSNKKGQTRAPLDPNLHTASVTI